MSLMTLKKRNMHRQSINRELNSCMITMAKI